MVFNEAKMTDFEVVVNVVKMTDFVVVLNKTKMTVKWLRSIW